MSAILGLLKRIPSLGGALTYAPWVTAGVSAMAAVLMFGLWRHEQAARTADRLAQEQAVRKAEKKAAVLSDELVIQQAIAMAATEKKAVQYVDRIKTIQSPALSCAADERMRIGSHGVRDIVRPSQAQ